MDGSNQMKRPFTQYRLGVSPIAKIMEKCQNCKVASSLLCVHKKWWWVTTFCGKKRETRLFLFSPRTKRKTRLCVGTLVRKHKKVILCFSVKSFLQFLFSICVLCTPFVLLLLLILFRIDGDKTEHLSYSWNQQREQQIYIRSQRQTMRCHPHLWLCGVKHQTLNTKSITKTNLFGKVCSTFFLFLFIFPSISSPSSLCYSHSSYLPFFVLSL